MWLGMVRGYPQPIGVARKPPANPLGVAEGAATPIFHFFFLIHVFKYYYFLLINNYRR